MCALATRCSYLNVLKWARAHHAPWNAFRDLSCRFDLVRESTSTTFAAAASGNIDLLQWTIEKGASWDAGLPCVAAARGHLKMLQVINKKKLHELDKEVCAAAARYGHLHVLDWLRPVNCPWDASTPVAAAAGGHLNLIEWARKRECPMEVSLIKQAAAANGHMHILEWAKLNLLQPLLALNTSICHAAAANGQFEVLKWLRNEGYGWDAQTVEAASRGGYLELLKWAIAQGCPLDNKETLFAAASAGHVHILDWALDNGCVFAPEELCQIGAQFGRLQVLEWLEQKKLMESSKANAEVCGTAATGGHLEVLQWLKERNFAWDASVCTNAVTNNALELLQWAHQNGCPLDLVQVFRGAVSSPNPLIFDWVVKNLPNANILTDISICYEAAFRGKINALKLLRSQGFAWGVSVTRVAAEKGYFELLKWARGEGCPWDEYVCTSSIKEKGDFAILHWAFENGCPWDVWTPQTAAKKGRLDILQWVIERKCPWDAGTTLAAAKTGKLEILQWALQNGCPWDRDACEKASRRFAKMNQWIRAQKRQVNFTLFALDRVRGAIQEVLDSSLQLMQAGVFGGELGSLKPSVQG